MPSPWGGAKAQKALDYVRRKGEQERSPCCLCGLPINYRLRRTPDACTVQHLKPRSLYPELTWDRNNWAPAHGSCNYASGKGNRIDIGATGW